MQAGDGEQRQPGDDAKIVDQEALRQEAWR
jgi:hypothetical protein